MLKSCPEFRKVPGTVPGTFAFFRTGWHALVVCIETSDRLTIDLTEAVSGNHDSPVSAAGHELS